MREPSPLLRLYSVNGARPRRRRGSPTHRDRGTTAQEVGMARNIRLLMLLVATMAVALPARGPGTDRHHPRHGAHRRGGARGRRGGDRHRREPRRRVDHAERQAGGLPCLRCSNPATMRWPPSTATASGRRRSTMRCSASGPGTDRPADAGGGGCRRPARRHRQPVARAERPRRAHLARGHRPQLSHARLPQPGAVGAGRVSRSAGVPGHRRRAAARAPLPHRRHGDHVSAGRRPRPGSAAGTGRGHPGEVIGLRGRVRRQHRGRRQRRHAQRHRPALWGRRGVFFGQGAQRGPAADPAARADRHHARRIHFLSGR